MAEFLMPSLGADMESGVLLEWLVHPGDTVHKGDIVAVVDTAKAAVEVECFDSGVVQRLLVDPGTRVPVGTPLATIATAGVATVPSAAPPAPAGPPAVPPAATGAPAGPAVVTSPLVRRLVGDRRLDLTQLQGTGPGGRLTRADVERAAPAGQPSGPSGQRPTSPGGPARPGDGGRRRASPLARRLAAELGVDLGRVTGSGPRGVVEAEDVRRAAAEAPVPAAVAGESDRAAAVRAATAAVMAKSKREIPHYYLGHTVDLTAAVGWLRERNRSQPVSDRIVAAALLLKAAALAARAVPQLNGFWSRDEFVAAPRVHLGVAVSLRGGGLVAPAIQDAADLDLATMMARLRDVVGRARAGRLRRAELAEPTITVSNLGDQGVEMVFGVIYPPQVALVGFGAVLERPWAVHGLLGVRPTVVVSLSADHRATDGAVGGRYLGTVDRLLQRPEEL